LKHDSLAALNKSPSKIEHNNFLDECGEVCEGSISNIQNSEDKVMNREDNQEAEPATPITLYNEGSLTMKLA
jgi:hypothetical protein